MATISYTVKQPGEYDPANPIPASGSFEINFAPTSSGEPAFYVNPDDVPVGVNIESDGTINVGYFLLGFKLNAVRYLHADAGAIAALALVYPGSNGKKVKLITDESIETIQQAQQIAEAEAAVECVSGILVDGVEMLGEGIKVGDEFPFSDDVTGVVNKQLVIIDIPKTIKPNGMVDNSLKASNIPLPTQAEKLRKLTKQNPPLKRLPKYTP